MVVVVICGYRSFGKCDHFTVVEGETYRSYFVKTLFFHFSFMPLYLVESFIGTNGGGCWRQGKPRIIPLFYVGGYTSFIVNE